jgi:polar amino acid transport system ATP-binding protein
MIIVENLTVSMDNQNLLDGVSCSLTSGHITGFVGKSGAGKTMLLKSLIGLVTPADGRIVIDHTLLNTLTPKQRAKKIGYVFQNFNLFPHLTVLQNCMDPLLVYGTAYHEAEKKARLVLQELDMSDCLNKYPSQLSGGQQQRTAIARALSLNPSVLLLDEPTASLDPFNTEILVGILHNLVRKGLTIGLSSQDTNFICKVFDRVYCIESGKVVEFCESPALLEQCPMIQSFMGK